MAHLKQNVEQCVLNAWFRKPTTAVNAGNASTSNILVTSSASFIRGAFVRMTTAGSYHQVTDVPDGTHVTISPAMGAAPTTGNVELVSWAPLANHLAWFTTAPTDTTGGTEASGGNYARIDAGQATGSWDAPAGSPSATANSAAIEQTGVTWTGTVVAAALCDASTGGMQWCWDDFTGQAVASGNDVRIAIGSFDFTLD